MRIDIGCPGEKKRRKQSWMIAIPSILSLYYYFITTMLARTSGSKATIARASISTLVFIFMILASFFLDKCVL